MERIDGIAGIAEFLDAAESADPQDEVNAHFRRTASFWEETYTADGVQDTIYRERLRWSLAFIDQLGLGAGASALDVGCGAGWATVALAQRRLSVVALDPVQDMLDATRRRVGEAGLTSRVTARSGDIRALPFADGAFDLVLALGVLPWLPRAGEPLCEMARVLRPGGCLVASIDTEWQLRALLDPMRSPLVKAPRKLVGSLLRRFRRGVREPARYAAHYPLSIQTFRQALRSAGLEERQGVAIGFGPFTFFNREIVPRSLGLKLHEGFQSLANRNTPIVRSAGSQYLVMAQKSQLLRSTLPTFQRSPRTVSVV